MPEHRYSLTRRTFVPGVSAGTPPRDTYWFAFRGYRLLVRVQEDQARVPELSSLQEVDLGVVRSQYLGTLDGRPCYSAELPEDAEPPPGMTFQGLRSLYGLLDEDFFWVAGRAVQIVDWDRTHQYCSACGSLTESQRRERVKVCPNCGYTSYPRLAPAIIVAVTRGDKLLLARSRRHPPGLYSVLAGFVEPGETLEECLMREVKEEVGLEVKNIRYFGSQPWPFPHSLMIAFTCEHAGGGIVLDDEEMEEAAWFGADELPRVPPPISISRQLIEWFRERAEIRAQHGSV